MIKNITIVLFFCCLGQSFAQSPRNYYFSSSTGNDSNGGTELSPFQTITKLNSLVLVAGDKILFKKGDTFIGQIVAGYSGTIGLPIVYDSYGTGNLPILSASDGSNGIGDPISTIRIFARQYLEFRNLQIENERRDTLLGTVDNQAYGIYYSSNKTVPVSGNWEDATLSKYLRFSNLRFQNIYAVNSVGTDFDAINTSGIHFSNAFVNDLIIEDCYFTDIERVGIWLKQYVSDAIIRNNKFIDIGGSGAIFSRTKRVLYENNLMRFTGSDSDTRMTKRGSGMWVFSSQDVVAQYNTSQHARGSGDSSGMHVDFGNTNILFQYNYLEDSAGGFCETLGNNNNIIWRYNISVNEGNKSSGVNKLLWVSDYAGATSNIKSTNVFVYNNTIYQGVNYQNIMADSKIEIVSNDFNFLNNIIYMEPTARLGVLSYIYDVTTTSMRKNIMYSGTINADFKSKNYSPNGDLNPLFVDPGRKDATGYKLLANSPAFGDSVVPENFIEPEFPLGTTGIFVNISKKATKDYFGNPVNLATPSNVGAYNGAAVTSTVTTSREAESTSNTIVGGTVIDCVNASGAKAVNVLANGQLTFNNFSVSNAGQYLIKVFYANAVKSNLKVTINGGTSETFILPNSNAYCNSSGNPTNFPIIRTLNSGNNTIKLENGAIDKIEVIFLSLDSSSWTGDINTVWTEVGNWNPSFVPTGSTNVTIAAASNQPVIGTNVDINSLSINSTASLTVNSGFNLTVASSIANGGTMTIENNANLIQGAATTVNANIGAITVKRNSSLLKRLDYTIWSSPVTNASQFLTTFSPATDVNRFYNYNETTNLYNAIANPSTTPFALGRGYLIRMPNNHPTSSTIWNGSFSGVPNNGTINKAITYNGATFGYNMIGNPYPSTINAAAFITANTASIESNLYFWRKTNLAAGSAYAVYNPLGGTNTTATPSSDLPNGTIQVGQGFFVKAKSGATSVSFTNAMRIANNQNQFFKTKAAQRDRLWLNLTNTVGVFSQALVGYTADATIDVDMYDAKYFNDSAIALTSNINYEEYTIQGRPTFDVTDVVALNFKTDAAGDYTIALDHFDGVFAAGQDIYLLDSKTGIETDLKSGNYTFTTAAGVDNTRFSLKYQKTLKVDEPAFNVNSVRVYKNNGTLYVNSGNLAISNIKVFDIQGRLIAEQKNLKTTSALISNLRASNQVLIVKIEGEDNSVVTKKVVN